MANRRSFLLALPQGAVALTAACALGPFRSTRASLPPASTPADAAVLDGTGREPRPTDEPPTPEGGAALPRVQPLPVSPLDDQALLREWLDLIGTTPRK